MKETELAQHFINWFNNGYEVYPEVSCDGGIIDFVATDGKIQIGCEVKNAFNMKVMEQAVKKRYNFHYTYICVPYKKGYSFREEILKKFELGCIYYYDFQGSRVNERIAPKLNRYAWGIDLKEYMKRSVAGSRNDRVTPFRATVIQMKRYLSKNGESHIDDVIGAIDHHYGTISTAKASLWRWIRKGVIEGVELERSMLKLKK